MRLTVDDARARLEAGEHGVLSTLHPDRGVDSVPAVYAMQGEWLGVPVDTVKPKASLQLQRERNLTGDPRATLLVDQWGRDDWSQLWWVRAELEFVASPATDVVAALAVALEAKYPQYAGQPFDRVLVLRVVAVTGWAATAT